MELAGNNQVLIFEDGDDISGESLHLEFFLELSEHPEAIHEFLVDDLLEFGFVCFGNDFSEDSRHQVIESIKSFGPDHSEEAQPVFAFEVNIHGVL